jgi:hypothetical protein
MSSGFDMAVLVEGFSVIVRRDAIERKYPGGWDAFAREVPNQTLSMDEKIARVGFMHSGDMRAYIGFLEHRGLVFLRDKKAVDITVASQRGSPMTACDWISFCMRGVGSQGATILISRFYDKVLWKAGLDGDSRTEPVATPRNRQDGLRRTNRRENGMAEAPLELTERHRERLADAALRP